MTPDELLDTIHHHAARRHADILGLPLRVVDGRTPPGPRRGLTPTHIIVDEVPDLDLAAFAEQWQRTAAAVAPVFERVLDTLRDLGDHLAASGLAEPVDDRPPMLVALDAKRGRTGGPPPAPLDGRGRRR